MCCFVLERCSWKGAVVVVVIRRSRGRRKTKMSFRCHRSLFSVSTTRSVTPAHSHACNNVASIGNSCRGVGYNLYNHSSHIFSHQQHQSIDRISLVQRRATSGTASASGSDEFEYDVLGIGQGMVDLSASVSDASLKRVGLEKGSRVVCSGESGGRPSDWRRYLYGLMNHEIGDDESLADEDTLALLVIQKGPKNSTPTVPITSNSSTSTLSPSTSGSQFRLNAGGSLSNTLAAIALLSRASSHSHPQFPNLSGHSYAQDLKVCMGGLVGSDALGSYFVTAMSRAGVNFVSTPTPRISTGKCVVLTTPDAQRTLVSDFGSSDFGSSAQKSQSKDAGENENWRAFQSLSSVGGSGLAKAVMSSRMVLVEGYLFEMGEEVIEGLVDAVVKIAKAESVEVHEPTTSTTKRASANEKVVHKVSKRQSFVCITLSDTSVVENHADRMRRVIAGQLGQGIDGIFGNKEEAIALIGGSDVIRSLKERYQYSDDEHKQFQYHNKKATPNTFSHSFKYVMSDAEAAVRALGEQFPSCSLIVVTDGHRGSYIYQRQSPGTTLNYEFSQEQHEKGKEKARLCVIPPCWGKSPPVDTCGAGDAYAAGVLYSLLQEERRDLDTGSGHGHGLFGSRSASRVIMRSGPRLHYQDALELLQDYETSCNVNRNSDTSTMTMTNDA